LVAGIRRTDSVARQPQAHDAALYITKLPKAEHDAVEWRGEFSSLLQKALHPLTSCLALDDPRTQDDFCIYSQESELFGATITETNSQRAKNQFTNEIAHVRHSAMASIGWPEFS
jgi:hypothetical protein